MEKGITRIKNQWKEPSVRGDLCPAVGQYRLAATKTWKVLSCRSLARNNSTATGT